MADRTSQLLGPWSRWRGLGIPLERVTALNEAESTYTEAGPEPGTPVAQADTEAVLVASGDQPVVAATGVPKTYDVFAVKAGMPGHTDTAAGAVWKHQGDNDYRGHDLPHVPAQWRIVEEVTGATDTPSYPHAVTLPNGKIVCAYRRNVTTSSKYRVETVTYDPTTDTWGSAVTVYTHGSQYGAGRDMHPCLMVRADGRIQLYFWLELANDEMQIRMYYSDDDGASWSVGSRFCLPAVESYAAATNGGTVYSEFRRIRALEMNGDVALVVSLKRNNTAAGSGNLVDCFAQFASSDAGATFVEIDRVSESNTSDNVCGAHHDLVIQDGHIIFVLPYGVPTGTTRVKMIKLASPWSLFTDAPAATLTGNVTLMTFSALAVSGHEIDDIDVTACAADDGSIYVFTRDVGNASEVVATRFTAYNSRDRLGVSAYNSDFAPLWACGDASTHIKRCAATWQRGRAVIIHQWDADPGDEDLSLGMLCAGGYSSASHPQYGSIFATANQTGAEVVWLPMDLPGDCGWTTAGSAVTETLTSGYLSLATTLTARTYTQNPTGTIAEGMHVWGSTSAHVGSVSSDNQIVRLRLADGTDDYDVSIRFGPASVVVYDNNAPGQIGSYSIDATAGVDFLVGFTGADIIVYLKARDTLPDREWAASIAGSSLTSDTGSPAANNMIQFGHASSTTTSRWYMLAYQTDEWTGETLVGRTYPQDLRPRLIPAVPVDLGAGLKVHLSDGPALYGDNWLIPARFSHPITNAMPWTRRTSPRDTHRTVDASAPVTLTWDLDDSLAEAHALGNVALVLGVFGANWRTGTLYGRDAGGSYSSLHTINAADGMDTLRWIRQGNAVKPNTASGGSAEPYLFYQECRGWSMELESGEVRRVVGNTEGKWDTTGKEARIWFADADGGEGSSGTQGKLWPRNFAIIVPTTTAFRSLRLVIDAQTTADGYIETGLVLLCDLLVHGQVPSWGKTHDRIRDIEETFDRAGRRRARKRSPSARRLTYAWSDWVDATTPLDGGDPDYVALASTGSPSGVASLQDTAYQLEGLMAGVEGGARPFMLLPRISVPSTETAETLNRRAEVALVVLDGDFAMEEVIDGAERVAAVPLLELT